MATNKKLPGVGKISQLQNAREHFNLDENDIRGDSPVRACENCGQERPSCDMINFICVIGSPGHHTLPAFQHPDQEHWACCIACWTTIAHTVVEEMKQLLREKHTDLEGSVHHGN